MANYYGQFEDPKVDEYLHKAFFPNTKCGFFIECGAYDGIGDSSCLFFEESLEWRGINIEPVSLLYEALLRNRPKALNLNYALTDQKHSGKKLAFEKINFRDNQSLSTGLGYVKSLTIDQVKNDPDRAIHLKGGVEKVIGISIKNLVKTYEIQKIDLLVLDVEGAEEAILKDLHLSKVLPTVLCIEDNFVNNQVVHTILNPLGYTFISKVHNNLHFKLLN